MNRENQVDVLNDLLAKSYDAEKGYREAADDVQAAHLKQMFREYSQQRNNFGRELKGIITSLGGEVEKGDTIASKLHRAWMDVKSAISSNEERNILEEVKRGEKNALSNYEDALEKLDAGSEAYNTVFRQSNQIREAISRAESILPVYER